MPDNPQTTPASPDPAGIARTETGEIKSQTQTTAPEATTPQTSTTPAEVSTPTATEPSIVSKEGKSLANQTAPAPSGVPEAYAAFSVPEGYELNEETAKEIQPLFKQLGLNQEQGQQLVDYYIKKTTQSADAPYSLWNEMQEKWVREIKADPQIGPRINQVTATISRAIDAASGGNATLAKEFREAMDFTGAGNNPAFIRMFHKMAQMITEGQHVAGGGPSPGGQKLDGKMPSAAQAMYPNLPSSS